MAPNDRRPVSSQVVHDCAHSRDWEIEAGVPNCESSPGRKCPRRRSREKNGFKKPDPNFEELLKMTKTKIALAAVLFAATSSAAFAQATQVRVQQHRNPHSAAALQQRDVALPTDSRFATGPFWYNGSGPTTGGM
jgi:hypothetical protein